MRRLIGIACRRIAACWTAPGTFVGCESAAHRQIAGEPGLQGMGTLNTGDNRVDIGLVMRFAICRSGRAGGGLQPQGRSRIAGDRNVRAPGNRITNRKSNIRSLISQGYHRIQPRGPVRR